MKKFSTLTPGNWITIFGILIGADLTIARYFYTYGNGFSNQSVIIFVALLLAEFVLIFMVYFSNYTKDRKECDEKMLFCFEKLIDFLILDYSNGNNTKDKENRLSKIDALNNIRHCWRNNN